MTARKPPYHLAGEVFHTKKAVIARCREILHEQKRQLQATHGRVDTQLYGVEADFLYALLLLHPEAATKIGCGVQYFFVDMDGYGGHCFWLTRLDGSRTDWSFLSCLKPPTHREDVLGSFRWAIHMQVIDFRNGAFTGNERIPCAITGQPITAEEAHIDHQPPKTFLRLVDAFLIARGLTFADIKVRKTIDGATVDELVDVQLLMDWMQFHADHALLRVTLAHANMSQGDGTHQRAKTEEGKT